MHIPSTIYSKISAIHHIQFNYICKQETIYVVYLLRYVMVYTSHTTVETKFPHFRKVFANKQWMIRDQNVTYFHQTIAFQFPQLLSLVNPSYPTIIGWHTRYILGMYLHSIGMYVPTMRFCKKELQLLLLLLLHFYTHPACLRKWYWILDYSKQDPISQVPILLPHLKASIPGH